MLVLVGALDSDDEEKEVEVGVAVGDAMNADPLIRPSEAVEI